MITISSNTKLLLVLFHIFALYLNKEGGSGVNAINCWDSSLIPLANRTDGATAINSGAVTCANTATTCATSTSTGAGTCSTVAAGSAPTVANSVMSVYCSSANNCNQITNCWNPAAAVSVTCTNSGSSTGTNTFACYTTNAGVGSCYTASSFTTLAGSYCFSTYCNAVAFKVMVSNATKMSLMAPIYLFLCMLPLF